MSNLIVFPEYQALKDEVEQLKTELSLLILERDELEYVECRNIEMAYIISLGSLEYKTYEAQYTLLRLKRKIELIKSFKKRGEKIIDIKLEIILNKEFKEEQDKLAERLGKMIDAIRRSPSAFLSEEEEAELKEYYRGIVKKLHPDLNKKMNKMQQNIYESVLIAYQTADLEKLRMIDEMVFEQEKETFSINGMIQLTKEKKRLLPMFEEIRKQIEKIKSEYPCTLKEMVEDENEIEVRQTELKALLSQYEKAIAEYSEKIEAMLGQ